MVALSLFGCDASTSDWVTMARPDGAFAPSRPDGPDAPDTPDQPPTLADHACFEGEDRDGSLCLPVVVPSDAGSAYDYPAPLNGNANYRAPVAYLDLEALSPSTRLGPNFELGEIAQASKGRWAVVQPHAVAQVQAIRDELGALGVNSGYRSPGYNAGIAGSATWSRHMYGDAFDLAPSSASLTALREACEAAGAGYVSVYTSHVHCDWRADPVDPSFFGDAARRAVHADPPVHEAWVERDGAVLRADAEGWDEGEPLREWWAFDASDALIDHAVSTTYAPPPGAARVVVEVGQILVRSVVLDRD